MVLEKMTIFAEKQPWTFGPIHEYEEKIMNAPLASASAVVLFYWGESFKHIYLDTFSSNNLFSETLLQ